MTTKELKNKIDKVLGNSIRCLLPSYWWKKLFNDVIDKIDNTLPIVDSQEKLNNLDIPNGGIASVCTESKWRSFNECYEVVDSDIELPEEELLNKLTKIYGIKVTPPSSPMLYQTIIIMLNLSNKGLCMIGCGKDEQFGDFATIAFDVAGSAEQFILMQNGIVNEKTVKKVNEILNTAPILYLGKTIYSDGLTDEQWNEFTSVFSWLDLGYSDVYVKNDSWKKLVKENMLEAITNVVNQKQDNLVSGSNIKTINGYSILGSGDITVRLTADSEMSSTSTNPVQNKVVYSELQKKQDTISDLADIRSGAALGKTALQQADIADLATKDDITNLTNEIITNEKIHAAALNDLNERLNNGGESSGGSGVVTFYIPSGETVTDEEIAKNKAAYEAYVASYTNPSIVRLSYLDIPMHLYAAMSSYDIESNKVVVGIIHQADVIRQTVYMIGADGSVMLQQ